MMRLLWLTGAFVLGAIILLPLRVVLALGMAARLLSGTLGEDVAGGQTPTAPPKKTAAVWFSIARSSVANGMLNESGVDESAAPSSTTHEMPPDTLPCAERKMRCEPHSSGTLELRDVMLPGMRGVMLSVLAE